MNLRVLVVGVSKDGDEVSSSLLAADYTVFPARDVAEALEAISLQKFDVVLLEGSISESSLAEFAAKLRRLEKVQEYYHRTPILCLADGPSIPIPGTPKSNAGIDGYFSKRMDSLAFTEAVMKLLCAVPQTSEPTSCGDGDLPVFELEGFQAQVGHEHELFTEIIELFLAEQETQAAAMRSALTLGDFEELARVAHTIKGSLASLHAIRSRTRAQELESAAKSHNLERCQDLLNGLEADLKALEHELETVRASIG